MCGPVLIGIGIGAAVGAVGSAVTGGNVLQGALLGGVMGGFTAGMGGLGAGSFAGQLGGGILQTAAPAIFGGVTSSAALGFAITGLAGSIGMGLLTPKTPDYSQFGYGAQPYTPQGFSYQHATVTGSGGRQAAAVLAQEIKKSRTLRQRQQEETTAYSVAGELASTGLQIA
jgi:hypothetical protein